MTILIPIAVNALKLWTYVYEFFTWPFYYIFQSKCSLSSITNNDDCDGRVLAKPIVNNDPKEPWRNINALHGLVNTMIPGCNTLDDLIIRACDLWPDKRALGTRKLVKSEMEVNMIVRYFAAQCWQFPIQISHSQIRNCSRNWHSRNITGKPMMILISGLIISAKAYWSSKWSRESVEFWFSPKRAVNGWLPLKRVSDSIYQLSLYIPRSAMRLLSMGLSNQRWVLVARYFDHAWRHNCDYITLRDISLWFEYLHIYGHVSVMHKWQRLYLWGVRRNR